MKTPGIWLNGIGSDVFGEFKQGQHILDDDVANCMWNKYLSDYVNWHQEHHHFHENYHSDKRWRNFYSSFKYVLAAGGVIFAGTVFNPNYTSRNSWYLRKMTPIFFASIGYQLGYKLEASQQTKLLLRMYDYLPFELRRAFAAKDFRYLVDFDYKKQGTAMFDPVTGKSLS